MVPIHESDVAENRWKEADWRDFELWERIELRLRRKRTWTILVACLVFISILSVPIFQDRIPKWTGLRAMRALAVRANAMKVEAASLRIPLRLRLEDSETGPMYIVEKVASCDLGQSGQAWAHGNVFGNPEVGKNYRIFQPESPPRFLCYDPISEGGSGSSAQSLGILPAKDLAESRLDRVAFLNFSYLFAEIDFD